MAGAPDAATSGSLLDSIGTWASVSGAGFALLALAATVVYGEIQRRIAREQLRLAREQAEARPRLRVSEMRLADLDEAGIKKRVEHFDKVRQRNVRWEEEREAREESQRQRDSELTPEERRLRQETERLSMMSFHVSPPAPRSPNAVPFRETSEGYEGPIPNKALLITVVNDGDEAAYEVAGWLRLEAVYLEPARLFSSSNTLVSSEDGFYRVRVGGYEKATLHGTRSALLRFRVAVAVRSSGTVRVEYDFTPAVGDGDRGTKLLEVPPS